MHLVPANGQPIRLWVESHTDVEAQAMQQLRNVASLPILAGPLAVMPDVHWGKGATIGSVVPTRRAIIPAAVGVDIGCGMTALQTNLTAADLPDDLRPLRLAIEAAVPVGFNSHRDAYRFRDKALETERQALLKRVQDLAVDAIENRTLLQIGSLGGGNHFLELCLDEGQRLWIMLHSGSRNIGATLAEYHIGKARERLAHKDARLPDRDLAWLAEDTDSREYHAYLHDLAWAQDYARLNRQAMLELVWGVLTDYFGKRGKTVTATAEAVSCHHNYVELDYEPGVHVTRKGAVSARAGQMGIIPGSMGTKSFVVRGKGHPDSYHSCSHGAGRLHSRGSAKRTFTVAQLATMTAGVECRKDEGVLDEIPAAYKPIEWVIEQQKDLIEVVHTLKQVLCIKG